MTVIAVLCALLGTLTAAGADNTPPVALDGNFTVDEDQAVTINIAAEGLASDADPDDTFYVATIPVFPAHGIVSFKGQAITYIPNPNYFGTDSFGYEIRDSLGASASATITLTLRSTPDDPQLKAGSLYRKTDAIPAGQTGTPLTIDLAGNIVDPDLPDDTLTLSVAQPPAHGLAAIGGALAIHYTPGAGFVGTDTFDYTVTDSEGAQVTGTVSVVVDRANTAPVARPVSTYAGLGQSVTLSLSGSVSDADGDPLVIAAPALTPHGSTTISGLDLSYQPNAGYQGYDTFNYSVSDGFGGTSSAAITVYIATVQPQASALNVEVQDGTTRATRLNSTAVVRVRVTDETGQPPAGVALGWTITTSNNNTPLTPLTQDVAPDADGRASATFATSSKPTNYTVTITAALGVLSTTATVSVATGLNAIAPPDTPEGAIALVLDSACPAIEQSGNPGSAQLALLTRCNELFGAASTGNDAAVLAALRAIAPEEAAAQPRASQTFARQQLANLERRLAARRGNAPVAPFSALAFNVKGWLVPGTIFADPSDAPPVDGNSGLLAWSGYVIGTVGGGEKDGTAREAGFDFTSSGVTAGMDYRYSDTLVGGALGYARTDTGFDGDGGELKSTGNSVAFYASHAALRSVQLDAAISYSLNSYRQHRRIVYSLGGTTVNRTARSSPDGRSLAISAGGMFEKVFDSGSSLETSLRVRCFRNRVAATTESGAAELNLRIDEQTTRAWGTTLAVRATWPFEFSWGRLIPDVDLRWEHDVTGDAHTVRGGFVQDEFQNTFALTTDSPDRDYFRIGFGATAARFDHGSAFIRHEYTLGRDDTVEWNIALGGRLELPW
jgi:hypothetical protein